MLIFLELSNFRFWLRSAAVAAETSKCGFLQVLSEEMQLLFSSILKKMITVEKKSHTNIHFFFLSEEIQVLFSPMLLQSWRLAKPILNSEEAQIKIQEFQNYFFNV